MGVLSAFRWAIYYEWINEWMTQVRWNKRNSNYYKNLVGKLDLREWHTQKSCLKFEKKLSLCTIRNGGLKVDWWVGWRFSSFFVVHLN